jgi:hypothetical protein
MYEESQMEFFDRRLAIDSKDAYHEEGEFTTLKEKFLIDIRNRLGKDYNGVIKYFHIILYDEIIHHTIRMMLKQNATRLIVSSYGNLEDIPIPSNQGNR